MPVGSNLFSLKVQRDKLKQYQKRVSIRQDSSHRSFADDSFASSYISRSTPKTMLRNAPSQPAKRCGAPLADRGAGHSRAQ